MNDAFIEFNAMLFKKSVRCHLHCRVRIEIVFTDGLLHILRTRIHTLVYAIPSVICRIVRKFFF